MESDKKHPLPAQVWGHSADSNSNFVDDSGTAGQIVMSLYHRF